MESPFLLETILVQQGNIPLLQGHVRRVFDTACAYGFSSFDAQHVAAAFNDAVLLHVASEDRNEKIKCRMVYSVSPDNKLLPICIHEITMTPYNIRMIQSLQIVEVPRLVYHHKFADRSMLNSLFSAKHAESDDILITQGGFVTDTSYSNVVFERDGLFVTPSKPLLLGVRRKHLIESGQVEVLDISADTIHEYDCVHLVNAMIGLGELVVDVNAISKSR